MSVSGRYAVVGCPQCDGRSVREWSAGAAFLYACARPAAAAAAQVPARIRPAESAGGPAKPEPAPGGGGRDRRAEPGAGPERARHYPSHYIRVNVGINVRVSF